MFGNTRQQSEFDRKRSRGATVVEFALILPLLIAMFYAIFVYGYIFVLHQALNYASEEAARAAVAVVNGGPGAAALRITQATTAKNQALSFLPAAQQGLVTITVLSPPPGGGLYTSQVTLTMNISGLFPVIPLPGIGNVPLLPATLQAISTD